MAIGGGRFDKRRPSTFVEMEKIERRHAGFHVIRARSLKYQGMFVARPS